MKFLSPRLTLPQWGLVALLAYPGLNPLAFSPSPIVSSWLVAFACIAGTWWVFGSLKPDQALRFGIGWDAQGWLLAWVAALAVMIVVRSSSFSGDTVFALAVLVCLVAAISMGAKAARDVGLQRILIVAWLVAALANSLIALCQYLEWAKYFYPLMNVTEGGVAYGNLRQRNQLATLLNMGLVALAFGCGLQADKQLTKPDARLWRIMVGLALTLLMIGSAVSLSRTGAVGLLVVVLLAWVWRKHLSRDARILVFCAPLIYMVALLVMPYVSLWVTGKVGNSILIRLAGQVEGLNVCQSRLVLYSNVLDLIQAKPWLGWGWRDLMYAHYVGVFDARFCQLLDNAHNLPLHLAVELGVPAALLLLLLPLWFVVKAKPWRAAASSHHIAWAVIALLVLHSMLEYPLWYAPFMLALGLCLGLLWPRADGGGMASATGLWWARARSLLTILALCAVAWASWGYAQVAQMYINPSQRIPLFVRSNLQDLSSDWLYADHISYYQLLTTPLTPQNALARLYQATRLMHYSSEPGVIAEQINAAYTAELDQRTLQLMEARFQSAYPKEYEAFKYGKVPQ